MASPKYVSVVWMSTGAFSTIPAKHVIDKEMLINFDLIGLVEFPGAGKEKPFPQFPACVFQIGNKLKDLLATEKEAGGQKVWQLKEQKILPEEEWDGDSSSDEGIED